MDEDSILDMDELAMEKSQLDFQEEMKDALRTEDVPKPPKKSKYSKSKRIQNGVDAEGATSSRTLSSVSVIADVDLLNAFQPVKNGDSKRRKGEYVWKLVSLA